MSGKLRCIFQHTLCVISVPYVIAAPTCVQAQTAGVTDETVERDDIIVNGRAIKQIGIAVSGSQGTVGYDDFKDKPMSRVGELVENVPGVIATQHSGTGKANQYFLRGFNLDHGTDFAGFVDDAPINMRSHGHGQGYLDLNFLIPELVERIDYRKGPYFADVGDFSAAGTVKFKTVDRLAAPIAEATVGSFGYYRALAAGSAKVGAGDLVLALDGTISDGPWVLDERLRKINAVAKYSTGAIESGWSLGMTAYHATWQATDQVPQRAIDTGLITEFGNIDPNLGGRTTRVGLTGQGRFGATRVSAYATYYDFSLTSNFTYFLDDPTDGDEFQQADRRAIFGGAISHALDGTIAGLPTTLTIGADARFDQIDRVGLYRSIAGVRSSAVREDRVSEASGALFADGQVKLTPRLRLSLGLRSDLYVYRVHAGLAANSGEGTAALLAPKAALAWRATDQFELYANYGESFHSNDARGATISIDPATGDPADAVPLLVRARGAEVGARFENGRLSVSLVGFYLHLGSELVFVGDAGSTEPNDASRRYGVEATLFWRPAKWLAIDGSAAFTNARFQGVATGLDRIPNAVENVLAGGVAINLGNGLSGSVRLRHFGAAPLIEDNSARSQPTTLANLGLYYRHGAARFGLDVLNIFDVRDADITYFYTSRLKGEATAGVDDYHLHPVEPRQLRLSVRYSF